MISSVMIKLTESQACAQQSAMFELKRSPKVSPSASNMALPIKVQCSGLTLLKFSWAAKVSSSCILTISISVPSDETMKSTIYAVSAATALNWVSFSRIFSPSVAKGRSKVKDNGDALSNLVVVRKR
eukprot:CAMPEP_0168794460 /NCGR_PEP_ID=MMETSP0725-20121227/15654_1 /TAXON_ID=265536 /ORGANISM="Amphiprora sp., Strain CCMP467" /LENGTH=126 /DNA_ID=CAMNT_0008845351 /DNA_START=92 /DNA_END=472 /DNA_ORIENTATION=-